jgi:putative methyltransferase (TIGR04325 family)
MTFKTLHISPAGVVRRACGKIVSKASSFAADLKDSLLADMEHVPGGWDAAKTTSEGWKEQSVTEAQAKHWPTLVRNLEGPGPLGVAHFPWSYSRENRTYHNTMMSYGYVLARAARGKDRLSILDWGGGAAHYYLYSKALLPEVGFDYECFDIPSLIELGKKLLPEVRFHCNESSIAGKKFDLVLSSSSLHYFEHWQEVAKDLACFSSAYLYVARLQTVFRTPSFVAIHNLNQAGYGEFLSWCINREELVATMEECDFELLREFVYAQNWSVKGISEKAETRGFLFRRCSSCRSGDRADEKG